MVVLRKTAMAIDLMGFILFSTKDTQIEPKRVCPGLAFACVSKTSLTVGFSHIGGNEKARWRFNRLASGQSIINREKDSYPL